MERYTKRLSNGVASWNYQSDCYGEDETRNKIFRSVHRQNACEKLAVYEDTGLEPEEFKQAFTEGAIMRPASQSLGVTPDRLRDLAQADKEGRCVVLPCKIGNTIYEIIRHRNSGTVEIAERTVLSVENFQDGGYIKMQSWVPCHYTGDILKQRVDSWAKIEDFGKAVFLTRKEAEAALRMEWDNG